jgi:hypothetical protein
MKNRKGCVMGTSIHKNKSSEGSPVKFLGRRRGAAPAPEALGALDPVTGERSAPVEQGGSKGQLLKTLLNPAGAIANKMGAGDTALGKALNPLGGLFGRK